MERWYLGQLSDQSEPGGDKNAGYLGIFALGANRFAPLFGENDEDDEEDMDDHNGSNTEHKNMNNGNSVTKVPGLPAKAPARDRHVYRKLLSSCGSGCSCSGGGEDWEDDVLDEPVPSDYGVYDGSWRAPCPTQRPARERWQPTLRTSTPASAMASPPRLPQSIPDLVGYSVHLKQHDGELNEHSEFSQSKRELRITAKREQRKEVSTQRRLDFQKTGIQTLRRDEAQRAPLVAPVGAEDKNVEYDVVRAIVDSGAEDTVAPPGVFATKVVSSPMSRAGRKYRAANGAPIENMGQTMALFTDALGRPCGLPFQIAAVERPLISVTQLSDSGHETQLGKTGGMIVHTASGRRIPLRRDGGVYTLEMRVPKAKKDEEETENTVEQPGFHRQVTP